MADFILHVDADAFFASVEQALNPDLLGKPVIVGGSDRGVVSAASYEARTFGVRSAMPMIEARRRCSHAVFLSPNFAAYKDYSRRMFDIMRGYSPAVETTSIDEGYVDLGGTLRLHNAPPWGVAHELLGGIRSALGINVSGGMAGTRVAAKMATGLAKPNGLVYIEPGRELLMLGGLSVGAIPGVGPKAREMLKNNGIHTVAELTEQSPERLRSILGQWGERLAAKTGRSAGAEIRTEPRDLQKSYSKDRTLDKNTRDYKNIRSVARELGEKLAGRLRADSVRGSTITVKIRYADFGEASRSMTVAPATDSTRTILAHIDALLGKAMSRRMPVRLVSVKISGIEHQARQLDLFDSESAPDRSRDRAVDTIRDRFGFHAIKPPTR